IDASDDSVQKKVAEHVDHIIKLLSDPNLGTPIFWFKALLLRAAQEDSLETDTMELRSALRAFHKDWQDSGLDTVSSIAVGLRSSDPEIRKQQLNREFEKSEATAIKSVVEALAKHQGVLNVWADLEDTRRQFSATLGDGTSNWLHTQTIVI